ncbi:MAG: MipA/OmpV family protein [Thioalkalispiraceae bacterium]|jgi:outer membrane scaffolding protein for murein synthesis (MipA/OmpV family)
MKKIKLYSFILTCISVFLGWGGYAYAAPAPIITSTQERENKQDNAFGVGVTGSNAQRPFVGVDQQPSILPYFSYKYQRFYIEGLDMGYTLYSNESIYFDMLATPRFYEVKSSFADNGELDGIDKTNPSYFAGLSTQIKSSFAIYTFQLLHDLLESDGAEAVFQVSKSFHPEENFNLAPSVGLTYQDAELVDYYYGVQAHEVRAGRPFYEGRSSLNYNVTLNGNWYITRHIELLGQIKYEILGDGISDSPIVDDDSLFSYTLGMVYRF